MIFVAIVVWYHPENLGPNQAVQNIFTYSSFCDKIYIIDNSPNDNSNLAFQIPNSKYIPNFDNLGIARAQNLGCEVAINEGHSWAMTMDQDSSFDNDEIFLYLNEVNKINSENNLVVSFSPKIINQNSSESYFENLKKNLKNRLIVPILNENKRPFQKLSDYEYHDRVLASGNIINLDIWKKIGKFNEDLFIDDVDYEFCYRLVKNGFKIAKINKCKMKHQSIGSIKTIFPHSYRYSKERIYYITRNKVFIIKQYPEFAQKYKYKREIVKIVLEKLFYFELISLTYSIKGIIDGKNNKLGKYKY